MIDRKLQRDVLEFLQKIYPEYASHDDMPMHDHPHFEFNLFYLHGHGLITGRVSDEIGAKQLMFAEITPRGIDHLADDGGLSAILGVVTVKLHADSIKTLIESKILSSTLPTAEKKRLAEAIRNAPSQFVSETVKRLVGLALDQVPSAVQSLQSMIP